MSAGPREQTTEPARDVVKRAKKALDRTPCPCGERECNRLNQRELARLVPELVAQHEQLVGRLKAFGRDCVHHGDMTPGAERMLTKILDGDL